jgi:hypothetical protein
LLACHQGAQFLGQISYRLLQFFKRFWRLRRTWVSLVVS